MGSIRLVFINLIIAYGYRIIRIKNGSIGSVNHYFKSLEEVSENAVSFSLVMSAFPRAFRKRAKWK